MKKRKLALSEIGCEEWYQYLYKEDVITLKAMGFKRKHLEELEWRAEQEFGESSNSSLDFDRCRSYITGYIKALKSYASLQSFPYFASLLSPKENQKQLKAA